MFYEEKNVFICDIIYYGDDYMEKKKNWVIEIIPYIIVIIVVLLIKKFVATPIRVNGPSMEDTLHNNDYMILNEIGYRFKGIKRFDIVVIKNDGEYLIKRVIGLPGEKIRYEDNKLYVNDKYVAEDFNHAITMDIEELEVPEGEYYVLGDNRVNSTDSRIIGTVSLKDIKGTTSFTVYPFDRFGKKK